MKTFYLLLFSALTILFTNSGNTENGSVKPDREKIMAAVEFADSMIGNSTKVFFKNVRSLLVSLEGNVIFEKYYNGCVKDSLSLLQSQTKSINALLTGIAIDKGFISGTDLLVSTYFPEYFSITGSLKSVVTLRHLLTMTGGFLWDELSSIDPANNDNLKMFSSGDYLKYALSRSMESPPGKKFNYNSGSPVIISALIEKASGMKIDSFAAKYLFSPLGISEYYWIRDSRGLCHAGGGLWLKPKDMMKIGILVLNKGIFNDRRVVPGEWIEEMTTPYFPTGINGSAYGYLWWIDDLEKTDGSTIRMISAQGAGGQRLYIFPGHGLVISFTENNYNTPIVSPMFIKEGILPLLD